MRAVVGSDALVRFPLFTTDAEVPTTPTGLTVTVVTSDGTELADPDVDTSTTGRVVATLTAADHLDQLDTLTVTAAGTIGGLAVRQVATVDVVSRPYLTLSELRDVPDLSNTSTFPRALLEAIRDEHEAQIEDYVDRAFVPRFRRETIRASRPGEVVVTSTPVRAVRSITVDGTAVTAADATVRHGLVIEHDRIVAGYDVVVGYEHGDDAPPPRLVRELAGLIRRDALAWQAKAPRDALSETYEGVTTRFSIASPDRPTAIPSLDGLLNRLRTPGLA